MNIKDRHIVFGDSKKHKVIPLLCHQLEEIASHDGGNTYKYCANLIGKYYEDLAKTKVFYRNCKYRIKLISLLRDHYVNNLTKSEAAIIVKDYMKNLIDAIYKQLLKDINNI